MILSVIAGLLAVSLLFTTGRPVTAVKVFAETLTNELVVYDPVAGKYVALDGESLLDGEQRPRAATAEELSEEMLSADGGFTIGRGLGRSLTEQEQRGFSWLVIIGAAGALILITIYFRARKKG